MTETIAEARLARVLTPPTEAPDFKNFRPTRDNSGGLRRRLEEEELWSADGIDRGIAEVIDALPRLEVESALSRLSQGDPAEYDIDEELKMAPAAEVVIRLIRRR